MQSNSVHPVFNLQITVHSHPRLLLGASTLSRDLWHTLCLSFFLWALGNCVSIFFLSLWGSFTMGSLSVWVCQPGPGRSPCFGMGPPQNVFLALGATPRWVWSVDSPRRTTSKFPPSWMQSLWFQFNRLLLECHRSLVWHSEFGFCFVLL